MKEDPPVTRSTVERREEVVLNVDPTDEANGDALSTTKRRTTATAPCWQGVISELGPIKIEPTEVGMPQEPYFIPLSLKMYAYILLTLEL